MIGKKNWKEFNDYFNRFIVINFIILMTIPLIFTWLFIGLSFLLDWRNLINPFDLSFLFLIFNGIDFPIGLFHVGKDTSDMVIESIFINPLVRYFLVLIMYVTFNSKKSMLLTTILLWILSSLSGSLLLWIMISA